MRTLCLKIDVCTREGLHRGVPRLLTILARRGVRASFFLSFGPDQSGRAIAHLLNPLFLRKMLRSGAPRLYGWRTLLSGTLLPARLIAADCPGIVRGIAEQGHEIALHGWNHRRWQDHLAQLDAAEIRRELELAAGAFEAILHRPPRASGAPAWIVTPESLRLQDELALEYASDLRGGPPCRLRAGGVELSTTQLPTTGTCIEELLAQGVHGEAELSAALLAPCGRQKLTVLALHAEVEGGAYAPLFARLLPSLQESVDAIVPLADAAAAIDRTALPTLDLAYASIDGRFGPVATVATPDGHDAARRKEAG